MGDDREKRKKGNGGKRSRDDVKKRNGNGSNNKLLLECRGKLIIRDRIIGDYPLVLESVRHHKDDCSSSMIIRDRLSGSIQGHYHRDGEVERRHKEGRFILM